MAKICGIENVAFVGKDGTEVRGKRIHFTEAIAADRGAPSPDSDLIRKKVLLSQKRYKHC